jgi:hypothetical protein
MLASAQLGERKCCLFPDRTPRRRGAPGDTATGGSCARRLAQCTGQAVRREVLGVDHRCESLIERRGIAARYAKPGHAQRVLAFLAQELS